MSFLHQDLPKVDVRDLIARMDEVPRSLWLLSVGCLLIGVAGFIAGVGSDAQRAWTALVWNWAFWSGIAIGSVAVTAAVTTAGGRWMRPIRRLSEGASAFLPVSFGIMVVLLFGIEHVYEWVDHPIPAKQAYLNPSFFAIRQLVVVGVLFLFALTFVYWSLRPDLGRLRDGVTGWRAAIYGWLTAGWKGLEAEVDRSRRVRGRMAPALALGYACLWTIWAWDWMMSIDPHWFSTLFGAWVFMTHFLSGLGATAVIACLSRRYRSFSMLIGPRTLHDAGKMVFAFTVFWTYLFFAQYLVIWYGRLAEETTFVKLRLWGAHEPVAIVVLLGVFLIPFFGLLGIKPKRTPKLLTTFALVSLVGLLAFHFLIIAPGVFPDAIVLGWIEMTVALGVFGAYSLSYLTFIRAFPSVALAGGLPVDPVSEEFISLTEPHHH